MAKPGLLFLLDAVATAKATLVIMNLATASILYQKTNFECTIFFLSTSQRWRALRRLFPEPALRLVLVCSFKTGLKDPIYFICEHVCWR